MRWYKVTIEPSEELTLTEDTSFMLRIEATLSVGDNMKVDVSWLANSILTDLHIKEVSKVTDIREIDEPQDPPPIIYENDPRRIRSAPLAPEPSDIIAYEQRYGGDYPEYKGKDWIGSQQELPEHPE